ncbi:MAG: PEP-CTERM sorting domain-containing protein [Candidatus Scalindua rubra]|uniref:TSP C-terminal domain-containing protein n=1 Tax=Candidatus Scalindua brodae TaxID=237368 RepID=A0A0B0EQQ8_9BACT|nr:MAG: hypothetical protein SCABRO_01241 [Candidatus Scalindua brodae]MBZ0108539.1 PEP-CTERM sorting domain-containing protein [Candidatus Scalindua rubra]
MRKSLLILVSVVCFFGAASMTTAAPIDLGSWTQEGPQANGNWVLQSGNTEVLQTINGNPTYFVSDTNYINTQFDGSFGVETTFDDDYIGFVFGYNSQSDFLLFDWKQANQPGGALEGFTLSRISGTADVDFWDHTGTDIAVLATDYSTTNGWADNTVYAFSLIYTPTNIKISIDSTQIFDVNGSFSDGKFGFYNYSQQSVRYKGFEEQTVVPEPATIALLGIGLFGLAGTAVRRKRKNKVVNKT